MAAFVRVMLLMAMTMTTVGWAAEPMREDELRRRAERLADQAQRAIDGVLPDRQQRKRDGIFVLVSLSLDTSTLQTLFDQSRVLGARVVFRGLPQNSMRVFQRELRRILDIPDEAKAGAAPEELVKHPADVVIDPVLFRDLGIDRVPALVIREGERMTAVVGNGDVPRYLAVLAREEPAYQPLERWYRRRWRGWLQGGPTTDPRPALPKREASMVVATGAPGVVIAEENLIDVIERRIAAVDWQAKAKEASKRAAAKVRRGPALELPVAQTTETYMVDPTVTVDHEVRDEQGRVLVAAGQRVNPLRHLTLAQVYVVFDAGDARQVQVVESYLAEQNPKAVKVMVIGGDVLPLIAKWQRPVYWANQMILDRFGVRAVPAFVRQVGEQLEVTLVGIP